MMELPREWDLCQLGDVAQLVRGVTYNKAQASDQPAPGLLPLLRATNIGGDLSLDGEMVYVPAGCASPTQLLQLHDIVLAASSGSISVVGKSAMLRQPWVGTFGAFCSVLRVSSAMDPRFLGHYVSSQAVRSRWSEAARGTNINNLKRGHIVDTPVPVPPLDEQRRIVEILEDHLSRLDAAGASLRDADRRADALRRSAMARLPWEPLRALADVAEIQGGIQKQPRRRPSINPYPFLRVANVTAEGLDLADVHQVELFDGELERLRLLEGDLLVVEGNGSPTQIGRAAIWDDSIPDCVHQNHLIRVRPGPQLLPAFLEAAWNSPRMRRQLTNVASSTSGLYTLSVSKLARLLVPVPSFDQQEEATGRLMELQESIGRVRAEVRVGVARASQLRRALLAAAFTGRLTGGSSDEELVQEPASV